MVTRAASGGGGDPFSGYVVSLLHFDGVNGSTIHTDVMGIPWTAWGGPTITTADSKFGGACASFDGNNDFLYVRSDAADFNFGNGEFCIEAWVKFTSVSGFDAIQSLWYDNSTNRAYVLGRNGTALVANISTNGTTTTHLLNSGTGVVSTGVWYHVALSRENNTSLGFDTFRLFKDGVVVASVDIVNGEAISVPAGNVYVEIGDNFTGSLDYTGLMDEMRVTKGAARYTGAFTPPTAPFPDPA